MTVLLLVVLIAGGFEVAWARVPGLHPHRWHFRGMLLLFWTAVLALMAIDRMNLAPGLFFQGTPRFASDAVTYQRQAGALADHLRQGAFSAFGDDQYFNYSRVLAVVYLVFGNHAIVGGVFNAVFYITTLVALFCVGRQLFNEHAGLVGAWLFAVSPTFLLHDTQTLRWAATTAGLHVAVLGTLLLPASGRWPLGFVLGLIGFSVLVADLPYIARLFVVSVAGYALVVPFFRSVGRDRFVIAARFAAFAVLLAVWYQWSWAPAIPVEDRRIEEVLARRERQSPKVAPRTTSPAIEAPPVMTPGTPAPVAPAPTTTVPIVPPASVPEKPTAVSLWSSFDRVTAPLDGVIAPVLLARVGFLDEADDLRRAGVPLGTTIEGPELATFGEFVRNLPTAYAIVMVEPSIPRLLSNSASSSRLRKFAIVEMIFYYGVIVGSCAGVILAFRAGSRTRMRTLFILLLIAGAFALLGTSVLNGGTLHRLRQPYVGFLCAYAAGALTWRQRGVVRLY